MIIIRCDPRASHRAAEALRIATGLAVWKQIEVAIHLDGPATRLFDEDDLELKDTDVISQCRDLIRENGIPITYFEEENFHAAVEHSAAATRINKQQFTANLPQFRNSASF